MPIAVPQKTSDFCLFQTGLEPRARRKGGALSWEDVIAGFLVRPLNGLDCSDRVVIQVDGAVGSILGLGEFDGATLQMYLGPAASVLLRKPHPSLYADHELGEVLREALTDYLMEPAVFVLGEVPGLALRFLAMVDRASRIGIDLAVLESTAVAEGEERSVTVPGGGRLAAGPQPSFDLLRVNLRGISWAK